MTQASPSAPTFSAYQWFLIALLALLQFTVILDFMVLSPLGDILIKSLGISPSRFGIVVSSYAFSAGVASLLAAGFADQFDRKKLLLFFYVGFTVGTLGCGLASSYILLLAARILTGLFAGVIGSILLAIIADEFALQQRGRVMGIVQMAFAVSQILGVPVGLYLATLWTWHAPFLLIVGLAVFISLAIWLKMRSVTKHLRLQTSANPLVHLWDTITNKSYWNGYIAIAFMTMGGFILLPFSSSFLINNVGISPQQLPLVYLFTGLASLVILPLIGQLSDRFSKFRLFSVGSMLGVILVILYTQLQPVPLWEVVLINIMMTLSIMSRMIPATALNTSVPDLKDRGAYISITASLQQLAGGVASVVAGLIISQATKTSPLLNFDTLGYIVSVLALICIGLVYRVSRLVTQKQSQNASTLVASARAKLR